MFGELRIGKQPGSLPELDPRSPAGQNDGIRQQDVSWPVGGQVESDHDRLKESFVVFLKLFCGYLTPMWRP